MKYYRSVGFRNPKDTRRFYVDILKKIFENDIWSDEYYNGLISVELSPYVAGVAIEVTDESETLTFFDCVTDAISRYEDRIHSVSYEPPVCCCDPAVSHKLHDDYFGEYSGKPTGKYD